MITYNINITCSIGTFVFGTVTHGCWAVNIIKKWIESEICRKYRSTTDIGISYVLSICT